MTNHWDIELAVIKIGKRCIADITGDVAEHHENGDPSDTGGHISVDIALKAIEECLRLGHERNDERNELQRKLDDIRQLLETT